MKSNLSSLGSLMTNAEECINVVNQGSGNSVQINVGKSTDLLKEILRIVKEDRSIDKKVLEKLDSILISVRRNEKSSEIGKLELRAARFLDTLKFQFLHPDTILEVRSKIFNFITQAAVLKCNKDLEIIEIAGVKYFVADNISLSTAELFLFERSNIYNRLLFKYKNKFGYCDSSGNIIIPPKYDTAYVFSEGLAFVKSNYAGEWFIDINDSIVIDITHKKYENVSSFFNGVARVVFKDNEEEIFQRRYNYINKKGQLISYENFLYAYDFQYGLGCVSKLMPQKYKNIDSLSTESVDRWLVPAFEFSLFDNYKKAVLRELADTYGNGLKYLAENANLKDQVLTFRNTDNYRLKTFDQLMAYSVSLSQRKKKILDKDRLFYSIARFKDRIDTIRRKIPVFGYIDSTGSVIIPFEYYIGRPFDNINTARVTTATSLENVFSFLIDRDGNRKSMHGFNYFRLINDDLAHPLVPFQGRYSYTKNCTVDTSGRILFCSPNNWMNIIEIRDSLLLCLDQWTKARGIITIFGLEVLPFAYEKVTFLDGNIIQAENKEGREHYLVTSFGKAIRLDPKILK